MDRYGCGQRCFLFHTLEQQPIADLRSVLLHLSRNTTALSRPSHAHTHTSAGEFVNADPKWIKVVSPGGSVRHVDWRGHYRALQQAANLPDTG